MVRIAHENQGNKGRFVLYEDDAEAGEMTYTHFGDSHFIIDHTGVEDQFGGKGYGKQLVMAAVNHARENGLKILPLCPYAKKIFDTDPSLGDIRF